MCGPHGRGQKGDLVVGIVRGHHLGCVLKAEQEREEVEEEIQRSEAESKRRCPLGSSLSHTLGPGEDSGSQKEEETEKDVHLPELL